MTNSNSSSPNKEQLYGEFLAGQRWRSRLSRKAAHKALDIPDDDVEINTTDNSRRGVSPLVALGLAAIAGGLPIAALWGAGVFKEQDAKPPGPVVVQPAPEEPAKPIAGKTKIYDYRVGEPIVE